MMNDRVKFHENSIEYFWHIPSASVINGKGDLVAIGCPTLEAARKKVRKTKR